MYILSGFWGEHRAILFRILELNKLKWDSYNAAFLMGYTCTCIYFNHWERCLLIESQISNRPVQRERDVYWLRAKSLIVQYRERCLLIESQVSNESNCHFWPLFIHFGKWPCDHNQPMALLQIPKNHKACPLELRACIPENSGIIEAYP